MSALTILAEASSAAQDQAFTLPQIIMMVTMVTTLVGLIGGIWTLGLNMRKIRRENEADIRAADERVLAQVKQPIADLGERMTRSETKSQDFMPKSEILSAIDHLKVNRQQAEAGLDKRVEQNARDMIELRVSFGKLEQAQVGLASDVGEIKALVKEQGRDTVTRFDKLQDCLATISRKVSP